MTALSQGKVRLQDIKVVDLLARIPQVQLEA